MADGGGSGTGTSPKSKPPCGDDESMGTTESEDMLDEGDVIENRFVVIEKMQSGSFGQVFLAFDRKNHDLEVALKVEKPRPKGKRSFCAHEVSIFKRCHGLTHVPEMYAYNTSPPYPYIAMQLMSFSLAELKRSCPSKQPGRFSLSTTIRVAKQCLNGLKQVHGVGVVHRDIKPSNFMLGGSESTKRGMYVLDFGLSRLYRKPNGQMVPARDRPGFVGSTRYASPNAHESRELGRGDDLVSLLYVLIELRKGRLPWRNVGDRGVVGTVKKATSLDILCRGLPPQIIEVGKIIQPLTYEDEPPYAKLEGFLQSIAQEHQVQDDALFDWEENFVQVTQEEEHEARPKSSADSDHAAP